MLRMSSKEDADIIARRRLLTGATGAAALLGVGSTSAAAFQTLPPATYIAPSSFSHLATLRNYKSQRSSSYDRSGGNADFVKVNPGATVPLLEVNGPGM